MNFKSSQIKIECGRRMKRKVVQIVNRVNCLYYTKYNYLYDIIKTMLSFTMCLHQMAVTHTSFNNLNKLIAQVQLNATHKTITKKCTCICCHTFIPTYIFQHIHQLTCTHSIILAINGIPITCIASTCTTCIVITNTSPQTQGNIITFSLPRNKKN